jgi:alkylation response protein AidB-like acyl-CoA dehydrogenase
MKPDRAQSPIEMMPDDPMTATTRTSTSDDPVLRAQTVLDGLREGAPRIEAGRSLPPDIIAMLHRERLFRILLPRSIGGDEASLKTLSQVIETIASADASTGWCMGQGAGCAMAAAYLSDEAARRLFAPKDAVLAWGAGVQGKAVATKGGYRVTGKWTFASGSANSTLLGGHCYVVEADGSPRMRADGRRLDRTALFSKSKARVHDMWHVMGLRGTASNTYEVEDLFVPDDETIDREAPEELREQGTLFLFPATQAYASAFSGLMIGIAQGMLRDLTALALTKTPRGAPSSLRDNPVFQTQLAQLEARLRAARAYLHTTLDEVWGEVDRTRTLTLDQRATIKLATTFVINQGVEIVTEAYRAAGQTAIFPANPFERRLRDALTASQQTQGRGTNYVTVGRMLLGLPPESTMFL